MAEWLVSLIILYMLIIIVVSMSGVKIIKPNDVGIWIVLGNYKRTLQPGFHFVYPLVSTVIRINKYPKSFDVPTEQLITKDNCIVKINMDITIRVTDAAKAYFESRNYSMTSIETSHNVLKKIVHENFYKDIAYKKIDLEDQIIKQTRRKIKKIGVEIEDVKLGEVVLVDKGKQGKRIVTKDMLTLKLRDMITTETEKFGIKIESIDFN